MTAYQRVLQGFALKFDIDHIPAGSLHRLLDSDRNFAGLTGSETDTTFTVTNNSQCGETELATTFDHFGDSVDINQLLQKLVTLRLCVKICHNPDL
jgi:hypothetical protein